MNADWGKLVVPLIFLAFLGLKQIFEREPQRPPARPLPPGPRPGGPRRSEPPTAPGSVGRRGAGDEVIIIRPESILPEAPRAGQPRRASRARPDAPARRTETDRAPAAPGGVAQGVSQRLDAGSISMTLAASLPTIQAATPTQAPAAGPSSAAFAIAQALRSPERLRDAFLVNELLQPPLSLRRTRRG